MAKVNDGTGKKHYLVEVEDGEQESANAGESDFSAKISVRTLTIQLI